MNADTIRKWWRIFVGEGNFTEVRILGRYQYSGYFRSLDGLIAAIEPYCRMDDEQLYFVLNEIDPACYGRQQSEKIVKSPKITTNDHDIIRRKWVMVDFDPLRKSGTNASDEEYQEAYRRSREVFRFLRDKGFSEPVVCCSGNGVHLDYAVDMPADDETRETLKRFFAYLGQRFNDERVEIDPKNFNDSRICKLYGTVAKKGANLPERPWRESGIIYAPDDIKATPFERFKELADLVKEDPKPAPQRTNPSNGQRQFTLQGWLATHGIAYREKRNGNGMLYELEQCPWIESHSDRKKWDSALFQDADGKITFNCTHAHCKDKTWHDVRLHYEPNAYDRQWQQPMPRQYQPRPRYEIKEEIPELGEKWLSLSQITKVDIDKMERVLTGYAGLDDKIKGLFMTEVTILSGSNSSGKSSWLNSLMLNVVQQGYKVALWSGELRPDILKAWIQMVAAGRQHLVKSERYDGYYVPEQVGRKIDQWLDGKFFLYNNEYGTKAEQIMHDIGILLNAGVRFFILDNLMTLDMDVFDGDENGKNKGFILNLKEFAKKNNIHVVLVAHPRKVMTFLRKNDISGTAAIQNAVDNIFIMHRNNRDFKTTGAAYLGNDIIAALDQYGNVIEVAKNRMMGAVDLLVGLHYEKESRRFYDEHSANRIYGWQEQPVQAAMQMPPQEPVTTNDNDSNNWWDEPIEPLQPTGEEPPF